MRIAIVTLFAAIMSQACLAEDWSSFRGSNGNGFATESTLPQQWSENEGVRWSVDLPRGGNGSPIVVGDRVLVTSAEDDEGHQRTLLCLDAKSGDTMWNRTVSIEEKMPTHKTNPYAGTTPASNGDVVVVWHGSAGLHAYDMDGQPLWSADLGTYRHLWGYGTSPVIVGDRVVLHTGPGENVYVVAFDIRSGKELWRHEEPVDGDGERNSEGKYMGSWSTPVIIQRKDKHIAVCAMSTRVCGLDTASGELLWFCEGLSGPKGDLAYSSPMIEDDLCVVAGGFQGPSIGFRLPATVEPVGNITSQSRLWRNERNPQSIGTGLLHGGYVYRPGAGPNLIECIRADSGEIVWQERVGSKAFWGSMVFDGTHAMVTNQAGTTILFRPSPKQFDKVAENPLGDTCNATPAVKDDTIYIRTYKKLWCVDGA
tara:strand:+ start:891703 stop:892977 length:1275 start_codon:yes stop_codon:yes gene_type:complete